MVDQVPLFIAGTLFFWLCNGVLITEAQDRNWTPTFSSIDPTNWFESDNWTPMGAPTATQSASVNTSALPGGSPPPVPAPATIRSPGAVANELLIGATIDSGVITSTAGEVIVTGTGASLKLSGTNLPQGQVSLDVVNGSLVVQNGGTLTSSGSGVGRFTSATTASTVTVTGAGSTWIENGTLDIGLANSAQVIISDGASFRCAGTVTIESVLGTLEIGTGGLAGTFKAPAITNNGLISANFTDTTTLSALVSGSGQIMKLGSGTLILTGNNTYSGITTISAGTLQLGNGGTTGSITGNVTDNGVFAVNRSDTYTFAGVISGSGSFEQRGTGTTILTGTNTYTGPTTVNGGSLIVDGSIASAQTLVNTGGLLGGRGSLGGNLVNSGIVSPGDSPGTLTVSRNYTQNPNGTLRIEIAGLLTSQHDLLAVGGHASLGGTLQLIPLNGFQLHVGDKVTFLTAKGGVSGSFSTVQNEFPTIVKTQVVILPGTVLLEGTQGSFVSAACNSNTAAVARSLDLAVGDPRAAGLINFLNTEPFNKLCSDFTLIAPEQLTSVFNIGVSLANVQTANLERRMDDVRTGSTGFSAAGFTMNGSTPNFGGGLSGPTGAEGKAGPSVLAPIPENRWGVFVTGLGEFTHVDSTDLARGFDLQTGGFTLGVDYRIGSNFAIGLIAGYAHTNADLANDGNLDVNSGKFGLYATTFSGGFYLDTAVTGGISGYDSHRTALGGTASGSTNGGDLNVLVNGGYDWKNGGLSIGPTASFQYTYVSFDGFTESGSLAPLKLNDQHVDSFRTAFGGKASYDWKVGRVLVRPELRAAWQHEYGNSAYSIAASFANGAGSSFTVTSPKIGRDSLLLGAGVAVLWNDRISTYIYYDGELGRTNYDSHNVSAGVRLTF
jgi:outer membrane autotransporter protein